MQNRETRDRSKWTSLLWALFICCCGGFASGIDHSDTEYMSSNDCALILRRPLSPPTDDPGYSTTQNDDYTTVVPGSAGCIRYEDVNEALRLAKKQLDYVSRGRNVPTTDDSELDKLSNVILETTRNLAQKFELTFEEINYGLPTIATSKTDIWEICPDHYKPTPCTMTRFRTYDGQCSSLKNSVIGTARTAFERVMPPEYSDGISVPKVSPVDGKPLPDVREISLKVHPDIDQLTDSRSILFTSWGQFIGHDITNGDVTREPDGAETMCCPNFTNNPHPNCNTLAMSSEDPFYWRYNATCMQSSRNLAGVRPGCALGPRTPSNFVSARLDGNFIYGNSETAAKKMRLGSKGFMKMWPKFKDLGLKDLLPPMTERPEKNCESRPEEKFCFLAGDTRVNFSPHQVAMHNCYNREHNRIATELGDLNPHWDDERMYQETRHIMIAAIQHMAFNELLPLLVGPEFMEMYNLTLQKEGYWDGYDKNVALDMDLTLQTAAFRWGHTLLHDKIDLYDKNHEFVSSWELHTVLLQPFNLYQPGAMDQVIGGMVNSPLNNFDRYMTSEVTKHLFQPPTADFGRDLASLNIYRGRDNGLPGYNDYREWCGLPRVKTFEELDYYLGNWTALLYSKLYTHPDDIDLWSAGIAEYKVKGGFVGPTFACIISRQFNKNRMGDRYWYENPGFPSSFTPGQLQQIRKVTQAKILCENADDFPTIQMWTLLSHHPEHNPRYNCTDLPQMDLKYWIEDPVTEKFQYV